MPLTKYKSMRSFDKTPEPSGKLHRGKPKKLEFVVQKHHASRLHYDFRLELDGVMKSWAVPKGPSLNPKDKRLAMMVEDHPYEYRKFEGVIPKGNYGAGNVIIWDRGTYELDRQADDWPKTLQEGLKKGDLKFIMHGEKLKGSFALIKTPHMGENAWLLIKHKDAYAANTDITKQGQSVVSGKEVDGVGAPKLNLHNAPNGTMPTRVKPMLATLTDAAFDDPDWLYEIKWDGYRAIAAWDGKKAELYSRNGNGFESKYPQVTAALSDLKHKVVLDGEVVIVDESGRSNFGWLQNWAAEQHGTLLYYVFDILWCDGKDLTGLPLSKRKEVLKQIVPAGSVLRFSDHIFESGQAFFDSAAAKKLEGIMAKDASGTYRQGQRSKSWLKIKTHSRQEAVIGGFTEPRGSRKHIGALILGVYQDDELIYVGHTGGGIPSEQMPGLRQKLESLERQSSPFKQRVKPNAPVHWVTPKLICEVEFSEWTSDNHMRQPIFVGMRSDKDARDVVRELPQAKAKIAKAKVSKPVTSVAEPAEPQFTHRNKIFFPKTGYTKGDLIKYYEDIGPQMLEYLKYRPHSLLRQPGGVNGPSFFQKDVLKAPSYIKTTKIYSESNQKDINYLVVDSLESLLYMVQLGCIEINPWNSRLASLENPDWAVIDLDPEKIGFKEVVKVALATKDVCDELKIPTYPKTSGKTGIHIFIPLHAKYTYDQSKQFAEILANLVHSKVPKITSLERSPSKRQAKIYIDFLQNRQGQTLAAPYSVRPSDLANVSTPLHWDEVNQKLDPAKFTIKNTRTRLNRVGELWCPVVGKGIDLQAVLAKLT